MYISSLLFVIFIVVSTVHILSVKNENKIGKSLTKPFLMPLLILIYVISEKNPQALVIAALVSAFLGDVFLMGKQGCFIAGVLSFLSGHIFYILVFVNSIYTFKLNYIFIIVALLYISYGIFIFNKLRPFLKTLKIPAILYIISILTMSFTSFIRINNFNNYKMLLPFIGSILFVISDTLLAFNIFKGDSKRREVYVMLTYILGQTFIILGFL
jgi:uncharacterized membrane protein YhhN